MRPNVPNQIKLYLTVLILCFGSIFQINAQEVTKLVELKIADNGLYFDGTERNNNDLDVDDPGFDFFFGRRITPHGDCIKQLGDYVFMTWYAGGESNRHVMLSRYNLKTEVLETIEFPHTHIGFRLTYPHIGDSHNTIAVGISPIDSTVHLLYDMHSYSEQDFSEDFFNYNVSKSGAAFAPDGEFTLDKFNPKQTYLNSIYNYSDITYPNFFLNTKGDLFVWFREGGNNNGSYKFAKYNGKIWGNFTDFNVLNARGRGNSYNWGLYGDLKYVNGKLRVGFVKRMNNNTDKYVFNNGWHYAYTDDPEGKTQWYNHKGQSLSLPIVNPADLFFFEPGDLVTSGGANSVTITTGADWTVTDNESIHFITNNIRSSAQSKRINVHGFKKPGESDFTISTDFPGGDLYSVRGNLVFLMGLNGSGRPYIYFTEGGTNDWKKLYEATEGRNFRHMNVLIEGDKLFMYLMERGSGDSQPIYLQAYDLGLPEVVAPVLNNSLVIDNTKVALFPNPASDQLNISYGLNEPLNYAIYNLSGMQLLHGTEKSTIDISTLSSGVYFIQLDNSRTKERLKFVVK